MNKRKLLVLALVILSLVLLFSVSAASIFAAPSSPGTATIKVDFDNYDLNFRTPQNKVCP